MSVIPTILFFFFFNDTATTEIYTLSLHDALPISQLPFSKERTDVLTCQSKTDIENINLMATLLSHHQALAYWQHLGRRFVADVEALLKRHLLQGILEVSWVHPATGERADDTQFFSALQW